MAAYRALLEACHWTVAWRVWHHRITLNHNAASGCLLVQRQQQLRGFAAKGKGGKAAAAPAQPASKPAPSVNPYAPPKWRVRAVPRGIKGDAVARATPAQVGSSSSNSRGCRVLCCMLQRTPVCACACIARHVACSCCCCAPQLVLLVTHLVQARCCVGEVMAACLGLLCDCMLLCWTPPCVVTLLLRLLLHLQRALLSRLNPSGGPLRSLRQLGWPLGQKQVLALAHDQLAGVAGTNVAVLPFVLDSMYQSAASLAQVVRDYLADGRGMPQVEQFLLTVRLNSGRGGGQ